MSEGELKKQIVLRMFGIQNYPEMLEKMKTKNVLVSMFGVNEVLDEAKKDFPKLPKDTLVIDTLPQIIHLDYALYLELQKWFKKWFGDAEP